MSSPHWIIAKTQPFCVVCIDCAFTHSLKALVFTETHYETQGNTVQTCSPSQLVLVRAELFFTSVYPVTYSSDSLFCGQKQKQTADSAESTSSFVLLVLLSQF